MDSPDLPKAVTGLEVSISQLNASFARVELWLFVATALLVIGLVVEYWDDIHRLIDRLRQRRKIPWHLVRAVSGGILVTIGVAWELVEEINASNIESKLQTESGKVDALLTIASKDSMGLIATANEKAENEHLARVELEAQITPRHFNPNQFLSLVGALKPFSGKTVLIESYALDTDSAVFGSELIEACKRAHVSVIDARMTVTSFGSISFGVHLSGKDEALASALGLEMYHLGISTMLDNKPVSVSLRMGASADPSKIDEAIFIGPKPPLAPPRDQ
jgi:hypothetical protein